jgi:apolipoprotein D and lipocalin family protein
MARTPQVSDGDYQKAVQRIAEMGYDIRRLRRVPQSIR